MCPFCDYREVRAKYRHIKYFTQKTPSPPTLNALIKLHKPITPIRPVVNNRTAPAYKATKKLNKILNNHLHLDNQYNITSSNTLDNNLTQLKINKKTQITDFGHQGPLRQHPNKRNDCYYKKKLTIHNGERIANQIVQLLETILAQNYFTFQNQAIFSVVLKTHSVE